MVLRRCNVMAFDTCDGMLALWCDGIRSCDGILALWCVGISDCVMLFWRFDVSWYIWLCDGILALCVLVYLTVWCYFGVVILSWYPLWCYGILTMRCFGISMRFYIEGVMSDGMHFTMWRHFDLMMVTIKKVTYIILFNFLLQTTLFFANFLNFKLTLIWNQNATNRKGQRNSHWTLSIKTFFAEFDV
jgi:hypothetical protein